LLLELRKNLDINTLEWHDVKGFGTGVEQNEWFIGWYIIWLESI
jgi:hypothetical protein